MNLLAIDTVTECCSVAVASNGEIQQQEKVGAKVHSRVVLSMVDAVLKDSSLTLGDLDAIVVDAGPGSFTGLRIGLGVAQGLAYGAGIPVIPVCSLDCLGTRVEDGLAIAALDARMNQVYWARYQRHPGKLVRLGEPGVINPEQLDCESDGRIYAIGNGWQQYLERYPESIRNRIEILDDVQFPRASDGLELVLNLDGGDTVSPLDLEAVYVRNQVVQGISTTP